MVETRAQAERRRIWEEMERRPVPGLMAIRYRHGRRRARYRIPPDHTHRHRLPDGAEKSVRVVSYTRRLPG